MKRLDEQRAGGEPDPWLALLLGLASIGSRADEVLPAAAPVRPAPPDPERDEALLLLLGIVSLRRRFEALLDAATPPVAAARTPEGPRARGFLR